MSIKHLKNIPLSTISTFRLGGIAKEVVILENEDDIVQFFEHLHADKKWFILSGGSNVVFPDGDCDALVVKYTAQNVVFENEKDNKVHVVSDAGVVWDEFVNMAVQKGLSGLEALSAIPGLVGSTPIQNVGAYGAEIKDTLVSLRAYNYKEKKFVTFSNAECAFGYRDSIFKHEARNTYLITSVTFALSTLAPKIPQYLGVAEYFSAQNIANPSLLDIRNAIISIRASKLPNPHDIASVGSFFKNPIVSKEKGEQLKKDFSTLSVFSVDDTHAKIGAGSMIDTLGWKGKKIGNFSFYKGNAMVIVHEGGGSREELSRLIQTLNQELLLKYGIELEPEPELVNF